MLNADDERVRVFSKLHRGRSITYGLSPDADVRGTEVKVSSDGTVVRGERYPF